MQVADRPTHNKTQKTICLHAPYATHTQVNHIEA